MSTAVKIGPSDHGRPMTLEEYQTGDYEEGYQYEMIDGKLYVSPLPNAPEGLVEKWIFQRLEDYSRLHPEIINLVYNKARVFVPDRPRLTVPEPDVAAYHDFPLHLPKRQVNWRAVSPILVVEVLALEKPEKDFVRNVGLYLQVPSIKEYWLLDTRADPDFPALFVYRRRGQRWQRTIELSGGDTYTTRLLPEFELLLDSRF
jgi:Uma2 family endonuclease